MRTVWLVCETTFQLRAPQEWLCWAGDIYCNNRTRYVIVPGFNEQEHLELEWRFKGSTHLNLLCMNLPPSPLWFNPYKLWLDLKKFKEWSCAKSHRSFALHLRFACSASAPGQCGLDSVSVLQRSSKSLYAFCSKNSCLLQYCTWSSNTNHPISVPAFDLQCTLPCALLWRYRYELWAAFCSFSLYSCWLIAVHLQLCVLACSELRPSRQLEF